MLNDTQDIFDKKIKLLEREVLKLRKKMHEYDCIATESDMVEKFKKANFYEDRSWDLQNQLSGLEKAIQIMMMEEQELERLYEEEEEYEELEHWH